MVEACPEFECEVLVVGAGIVGASVAYALAPHARVLVAERESQPGYHSTGRSAAMFIESYGNRSVRALNVASGEFFRHPDRGFTAGLLLHERGLLTIASESQLRGMRAQFEEQIHSSSVAEWHDGDYARRCVPILNERTVACVYDRAAQDIDVGLLLEGFLKGCRTRGGRVLTGCEIIDIARANGAWRVQTSRGTVIAETIVNAAGAWADAIASLAGLAPLGLTPLRRTAMLVDPPAGADISPWPVVLDAEEQLYFKPDAGRLLISLADETKSEPTDAQADEYDVAVAIDRFEATTNLAVRKINHKWAGLRTFAVDRTPVIGYDPRTEGFFWAAGLGGYGVQTSPAVGQLCAHLYTRGHRESPLDALSESLDVLTPHRLLKSGQTNGVAPAQSLI
jgi:D-arginine dehydrogenase